MTKLTEAQMRALRILDARGAVLGRIEKHQGVYKTTVLALERAGYARVTTGATGAYRLWEATITQAGRDRVNPPPIEPGFSLAMFLVHGANQWARNAENAAEALYMLCEHLKVEADFARQRGCHTMSRHMQEAACKLAGRDPEHTRFPVRLRFNDEAWQSYDFGIERCRPRTDEETQEGGG